jgi:DNA ligase 1
MLVEKYIKQKRTPIYQMPAGAVKTMKGGFYNQHSIIGWFYSEKLDGIHCVWTGRQLLSRTGRPIVTPSWWVLPEQVALVGELYIGRGHFAEVQGLGIAHSIDESVWSRVKFHVFDIPDSCFCYRETVQLINYLTEQFALPYLIAVEQTVVTSPEMFLSAHRQLVTNGAEGTMIRDPSAKYSVGVTDRLLKFKAHVDQKTGQLVDLYDRDATIVGYRLSDKLRISADALKSLEVVWTDQKEIRFNVSSRLTFDDRRGAYEKAYPIGSQIKVLYNELMPSGKPRFPRVGAKIIN